MNTAVWSVSPGLEAGDLGFHFNGDVWGTHGVFQWRQTTPDRLSRDRNIAVAKFYVWNHGGAKLGDGAFVFGNLTFRNYWTIWRERRPRFQRRPGRPAHSRGPAVARAAQRGP